MKLRAEHEVAVLVGFYVPGEIKLLCDIAKPQVGLVTISASACRTGWLN